MAGSINKLLLTASALCISCVAAATAFAQTDPVMDDADSFLEGLGLDLPSAPLGEDGVPLGWDSPSAPPNEDELDRPLTELEQLSKSSSGVGFDSAFYSSSSDNPLQPVSVTVRALDKITARYTDIEINIGESAEFGTLSILPRTCDKRPPEEFPETTAFLEISSDDDAYIAEQAIDEAQDDGDIAVGDVAEVVSEIADQPKPLATENAAGGPAMFTGWMFASSQALNPLEHPVYDVWVIDCKMVDPEI